VKKAPAPARTRQPFPAAGSRLHPPRVAGGEREGDNRHKNERATQNNEALTHNIEPSTHNGRLNEALVQQTRKAQGKGAEADTNYTNYTNYTELQLLPPWADTQLPPLFTQRARAAHEAEPGQESRGKKTEALPEAQEMEAKMQAKKMEGKKIEAWAESDYPTVSHCPSALEACHRGAGPADSPDTLDDTSSWRTNCVHTLYMYSPDTLDPFSSSSSSCAFSFFASLPSRPAPATHAHCAYSLHAVRAPRTRIR